MAPSAVVSSPSISMTTVQDVAAVPTPTETTAQAGVRDVVVARHFKPDLSVTVGLEFEAGGLRVMEVVEILRARLGVTQTSLRKSYWGMGHYLCTREFGTIRVEPARFHRFFNILEAFGTSSLLSRYPRLARLVHRLERKITLFEVVTQPITLTQVEHFAQVLDVLGLAGARGTGLFRPVSTQINVGIDPLDTVLMKNLLANYYGNHSAIRRDLRPHFVRFKYIREIHPAFLRRLKEAAWRPDLEELSAWYRRYSRWKKSSIELSYALLPSKANQTRWGKLIGRSPYPSRSAVEFREANTVTSTQQDPRKTSNQVMHEVRFAVAMVEAARSRESRPESMSGRTTAERPTPAVPVVLALGSEDDSILASLIDFEEDLADLAAHAESGAGRIRRFRRSLDATASNYRRGTHSHLCVQADSLLDSLARVAALLRGRLMDFATWTKDDLASLRETKREAADLLRTLHAHIGSVLGAGDWQSPSFQHSLTPQVGKQSEQIIGTVNDYTRGGYADATEYERAFATEYIDSSWRFPPQVFVTSSGMSAFSTILFLLKSRLNRGPVLVGASSYFENQWLLGRAFRDDVHLVDESDAKGIIDAARGLRPTAVFLDTLCNAPTLAVSDLAVLLPALARTLPKGSAIVLDNSGMSAACQPLSLLPRVGNHARLFVIESLNKYHQFGFDRVTGGIIWTAGGLRDSGLADARKRLGSIMPDTSVLSLPTPNRERLMRRLKRIDRNALMLAQHVQQHLTSHPSVFVSHVVYPGLPSHPCHAWTKDACFRGGSIILAPQLALGSSMLAKWFIRRAIEKGRREGIDLVAGTSFGFDVTRLYLTARYATDISKPILRVSAGTESAAEIEAVAEILIQALTWP
jgi:cystathionine beta-lyase/cystathionine gamma-synthase